MSTWHDVDYAEGSRLVCECGWQSSAEYDLGNAWVQHTDHANGADPIHLLRALEWEGFLVRVVTTGGNCTAWQIGPTDGPHVLLTAFDIGILRA